MTETTAITALRKKFGNTLPKPEHAREKLTDMLNGPHAASWFLTPYVISVLDALEAERQRANYGQQVIDQRNAECDRLINEMAALKGDQVPVAWIRERTIDKPEHKGKVWRDISYPAKPEPAAVDGVYHDVIIPLYDRPQKPDALPDLVMLVKVLARALKVANPDSTKPSEAIDYLQRSGLISASDCLRGATDSVGDQGKS